MKLFLLLFTTLLVIVKSQNGLTPCGEGSSIWNSDYKDWSDGRGLCVLPMPAAGIAVAGVNRNYFKMMSGSMMCGACFRLTGPAGSIIVQTVDVCDATDLCTQTDHAHFILSPDDYNKIANSTATLYNTGYQMITCPNEGNTDISVTFTPDGQGSYSFYFSIKLSGFTVPIKSVEVTVGGSSGPYQQLAYSNSIWVFNKQNTAFTFPGKVRVTSQTGQQIVFQVTNGQSKLIPNFNQNALYSDCSAPLTPEYVYKNGLASGWTPASWDYIGSNFNDASGNGPSGGSNIAIGLSSFGGLKVQSLTAFSTSGIDSLTFEAKANVTAQVVVFLNGIGNKTVSIGTSWSKFTVSMSDLKVHSTEQAISFQNFENGAIMLMVDEIKWVYSANSSGSATTTAGSTSGTGLVTMPPVTKAPSSTGSGSATTTSDVTTASTTAQVTTTRGPSSTTAGGEDSENTTGESDSENTGGDKHVDSSDSSRLSISIGFIIVLFTLLSYF